MRVLKDCPENRPASRSTPPARLQGPGVAFNEKGKSMFKRKGGGDPLAAGASPLNVCTDVVGHPDWPVNTIEPGYIPRLIYPIPKKWPWNPFLETAGECGPLNTMHLKQKGHPASHLQSQQCGKAQEAISGKGCVTATSCAPQSEPSACSVQVPWQSQPCFMRTRVR